jgi:hypothetical protein
MIKWYRILENGSACGRKLIANFFLKIVSLARLIMHNLVINTGFSKSIFSTANTTKILCISPVFSIIFFLDRQFEIGNTFGAVCRCKVQLICRSGTVYVTTTTIMITSTHGKRRTFLRLQDSLFLLYISFKQQYN